MNPSNLKIKSTLLVLGDQLFPVKYVKKINPSFVFIAEDYDLCTDVKHHKQKILLFFASMRNYAKELQKEGFNVYYKTLSKGKLLSKLKQFLKEKKSSHLHYFSIDDIKFRNEFHDSLQNLQLTEHESPKFLCTQEIFQNYLKNVKKPFMKTFYEKSRLRLNLLMENNKPIGGKFSFDSENRKKLPKTQIIPQRQFSKIDQNFSEIETLIEKNFKDHPGDLENFVWPINRKFYLKNLDTFIKNFLDGYGPYQDAMSERDPFLFHSLISPGLNMGLITPEDVVNKISKLDIKDHKRLPSIEGFLRQIIGWREFVKGIYDNYNTNMENSNFWKHSRTLKACWWEGNTGLEPVDYVIKKCQKFGYAHHIERLMIMANIFNLIEANPKDVYKWFMEMFVDSSDWVMQANVYGMGLMSDGGIFASKPYICGSNYILKMSDYKKGPWCDILDGLYWRFIEKKKDYFIKNPRMSMMVKMLDKLSPEKKKRIYNACEKFINDTTQDM